MLFILSHKLFKTKIVIKKVCVSWGLVHIRDNSLGPGTELDIVLGTLLQVIAMDSRGGLIGSRGVSPYRWHDTLSHKALSTAS